MKENTKVNYPIESRQWMGGTLWTLRILLGVGPPLLLFFAILVILFNMFLPTYLSPRWVFEAPLLLLVMNTLFGIICFFVALITLPAYIKDLSGNLLLFGCGMLSLSLTCFLAAWFGAQAQANVNLTIHNTGILIASWFTLLSSISLFSKQSSQKREEKERKKTGILAYVGVVLLIVTLSFAALHDYTPSFIIPGQGPTVLREVVLTAATIFFAVSCILIVIVDRYRRNFFLSCYAIGLGLITVNLIALTTSQWANSPLSWLGRFAQFAGGIYFLAAVIAAVRTAWANRWTVPDAIRDFLRPSEALYRDLVETTTDAIIPISTNGEILLWHTPAEQMFGYNRTEALRLTLSDLIDREDSRTLFREIETEMSGNKRSYVAKPREVKARRKTEAQFPTELSFSSRKLGAGWITTLVIRDITERKQAEHSLQESEQRYRKLVQYSPAGIYEVDFTTGRFTEVNDAMCQILGYTEDELLRMTAFDILDDEGRILFACRIQLAQSGATPEKVAEYRVRTKDGRLLWSLLNITFKWGGSKIVGASVVAHDITERKRAEIQLKEVAEKYSTLFNNTSDGVWIHNLNGEILEVNDAYCRMSGYSRDELTHTSITKLEAHESPEEIASHIRKVIEVGGHDRFESRHRRKDGSIFDVDITALYFEKDGGRIAIFVRDITERKRADEELRRSEEVSKAILNAATESVFLIDLAGTVLTSNAVGAERLGKRVEDIIGKNLFDLVPEEVANRRRPYAEQVIRAGKPMRFEDERSGKWIDSSVCPVFNSSGNVGQLAIFGRDITDRKRAHGALQQRSLELQHLTETLEQRVKERTAELASLSSQLVMAQENERRRVSYDLHDNVWQTLLAIRFEIENLFSKRGKGKGAALQNKSNEVMSNILNAVGRIRSMQGDLWPYVLDDIGIVATIDWFCREFEKNHSGITIETKSDIGEDGIPSSSKIVIYRILQEGLSNIAKHSRASHATVYLKNGDHGITFSVQDNGIGFDPAEMIAKRAPLAGLGLLNIKARTELSSGMFEIESAKDKGTTIRASWTL